MKISEISVRRPVTILMFVLIIITLGIVSFSELQVDLLPEINVPVAIVMTQYSGVAPEEIETLITRPMEQALSTVRNLTGISSVSSEGRSLIILEFTFDTDMDFATLDIREKVDMVKGYLPSDASTPVVMKMDPNQMPIIQLAFSDGKDLSQLQATIEDKILNRIERIDGVASVNLSGGYEEEIRIKVSQNVLNGYGISLDYIANILRGENLNLPGGEVQMGERELLVKTTGEFEDIKEIENLPIPLPRGGIVYIKDLGEVELTNKDITSINRVNGKEAINLSIQKESNANTLLVAERVNKEIEKIKNEFPNMEIKTILDTSIYIKKAIGNISQSAIYGGVLAIVVLYLFLRNIRSTFIIATAIPVSIIATFTIIYFSDITINLMTLGGLALGVGMLVDNAIVVLENIFRLREEGYSRNDSAVLGATEVGMAVAASTFTTIAVFLPIAFTQGIASIMFKELALTVTFSLLASLIVAVTLIPMLASKILKVEKKHEKRRFRLLTKIFDKFQNFFERMENLYKRLLRFSIGHRKTVIAITIAFFILTMATLPLVGAEFFPSMDQGYISISVELPTGSSLSETNGIASELEDKIKDIAEIDSLNVSIQGNTATLIATLKDMKERDRSADEIGDEIRKHALDIPGAKISVSTNMMSFGSVTPISIEIKGPELEVLKKISDDFVNIVSSVEGTREVKSSYEEGKPEVRVKLNRKIASNYGLTAAQVASSIRTAISGSVATQYKYNGTEIDVKVIGDSRAKESINNLQNLLIPTPLGQNIPLGQVADLEIARGPVSISRSNQVRTVTITSQIAGRDLGTVTNEVMAKIKDYPMPTSYEYDFGGESEEMMEAFSDLFLALGIAVLLVYMIMASQFESLLDPFIIMFTVPLALSGGALGLFLTGKTLNVTSIIGGIMLAGIVVNNAIVLVDYINTLRKRGIERDEAVLQAGPTRLRPILMTTLTTVLGLLPLAIGLGEGAEVQSPLATVVIFGLTLSTLLTLVFIPVLYIVFDNFSNRVRRVINKDKEVIEN